MKTEITVGIDTDRLTACTDEHLVCLWAVAQVNPAPIESMQAGEVAEAVAREMVRRFAARVGLPLWSHQGRHAYASALCGLGVWVDGEFVPNRGGGDVVRGDSL